MNVSNFKNDTGDKVCSICMEKFINKNDTNYIICNHKFHVKCLSEWMESVVNNCPLCRRVFDQNKNCPNNNIVNNNINREEISNSGTYEMYLVNAIDQAM